jgi:integrase
MSVFKKFQGKRITAKDKNWSKATWYIWQRINGRIIHKALKGADTKEKAEAAARKILDKAFNQAYGLPDTTTTFKEFAEGTYTEYYKQKNVNQVAKRLYVRLLVEHFKNAPLSLITPQDCRNCQQAMLKAGQSPSSVNRIMSTLGKLFTIAGEERIIDHSPMTFVKSLKEPVPRDRLLTDEERERLWTELSKDTLLHPLVTLALNLPLRRGQLLAISPDAVNLSTGQLAVIGSKGRQARLVPLNSIAMTTLAQMKEASLLPFPLGVTGVRKRWMRVLQRSGISNFRFHDLRKEFASNLIRNNVNPEIVRQLFAHSSQQITQAYTHSHSSELADAVRTLDVQESKVIQ